MKIVPTLNGFKIVAENTTEELQLSIFLLRDGTNYTLFQKETRGRTTNVKEVDFHQK
jgi:hypothetical protein